MTLYLYVSNDKYELPLAVAESKKELAYLLGKNYVAVSSYFSKGRKQYIKVEVEEDDDG